MSDRLDLLRPVLARYQRRFTVLDLGAGINHPTLGYEIAQEFDAVVVEVEKDWKPLEPIGKRTMVLKHKFTVPDLVKLSECEHFDVVLAFNFIHWFGVQWKQAAEAVLNMGDYVFVQLPTDSDAESVMFRESWPDSWQDVSGMNSYFKEQAEWLGSTAQFHGHPPRPIYMRGNGVKRLTRTNWDAPMTDAEIVVYSTHKLAQGSFQHKTPREHRPWVPGINLWNFCRLGGVVPSPEQVQEMLCSLVLPDKKHGDIQPWNMILDGERLHLIDGNDTWGGDDREGLANTIRKVEECLSI
jgi:hypothetical protein